jgi:hypothetical protein
VHDGADLGVGQDVGEVERGGGEGDEDDLLGGGRDFGDQLGLRGYTRARCYSSLIFLVTVGILYIKENGEGK